MLSEPEERILDDIILRIRDLGPSVIHYVYSGMSTTQWLSEKLKKVNDELKRANVEIERINKAYNWEDPCPHGYKKGDHHWFHCMGVSPFDPNTMGNRS